ncbi:MAG: 50S ribosomal protein L17 [Bacteroidales bacterium]|nr:50S ribosomal protein L17 [Bacteroidales bacterium]MCF8454852.1 50S ribosomal protein L17 [Bacteroidales bacterium]
MRHRKKFNHLGRKSAHRKAMLSNMANSLILHKRIETTVAKAKALRIYVEPLITKSKEDTTNSRRVVFSYLKDKYAVSELFREISSKVMNRPGGYTRIIKTGSRLGDSAEMCLIELVDYNENLLGTKQETKAKSTTRRSRRGKAKAEADAPVAAAKTAAPAKKEKAEAKKVEANAEVAPAKEEAVIEEVKAEEPMADEPKAEVEKTTEENTKE